MFAQNEESTANVSEYLLFLWSQGIFTNLPEFHVKSLYVETLNIFSARRMVGNHLSKYYDEHRRVIFDIRCL